MLLFVGPGGAGRTTTAAATAVALTGQGRRVLLASLDQGHALSDVLGCVVGRGTETRVASGLDAVVIDTLGLLEARYRDLMAVLALAGNHDHGAHFADLAPQELTGLPGVEEVLGLGEILRVANGGRWDTVVVDCPPAPDAFRFLAAPESLSGCVDRVWPQHRRVAAATSSDVRIAFAVALVDRVLDAAAAVTALLADRERTALRVVTVPGRVALARTRGALSAAALAGLRIDALIVNKVLMQSNSMGNGSGGGDWYRGRQAAQQAVLDDYRAAVTDVPVLTAEYLVEEPIGREALADLGGRIYERVDPSAPGGSRPAAEPVRVALESGSGDVDSVYTMRMRLPLVDPATLTLGRVEDDLLVGVDGRRRRVRLASVLRRCDVRDAEFDGEDLVVRFVPDPRAWPL